MLRGTADGREWEEGGDRDRLSLPRTSSTAGVDLTWALLGGKSSIVVKIVTVL